jgi:single-strand DNA-binding protein
MNTVNLTGRLTSDVELKKTNSGVSYCRVTVAVRKRGKVQQGQPDSDFISVSAFRNTAELVARYCGKGSMVGFIGHLSQNIYEKDGKRVYSLEVIADSVEFLGSPRNQNNQNNQQNNGYNSNGYNNGGYNNNNGGYSNNGGYNNNNYNNGNNYNGANNGYNGNNGTSGNSYNNYNQNNQNSQNNQNNQSNGNYSNSGYPANGSADNNSANGDGYDVGYDDIGF